MLTYETFYRKHGIRLPGHLSAPVYNDIHALVLPVNSLYHAIETDDETIGVTPEDPVMPHDKSIVAVNNVMRYLGDRIQGSPKHRPVQINHLVQPYFNAHHQYKELVKHPTLSRNPRTLVVDNYGLLHHMYQYAHSQRSSYFEWANYYRTVIANVAKEAESNNRQQYIVMPIPDALPPVSLLTNAENGVTDPIVTHYHDHAAMFVMDTWVWCSNSRHQSILGTLLPEHLKRLNFIWLSGGRWVVLNLGVLDSWINREVDHLEGTDEEIDAQVLAAHPHAPFTPKAAQRRYLRFMMSLRESSHPMTDEDDSTDIEAPHVEQPEHVVAVTGITKPLLVAPSGRAAEPVHTDDEVIPVNAVDLATHTKTNQEVAHDLEALEFLHQASVKEKLEFTGYRTYEAPKNDLHEHISKTATALAGKGLLSAAEVRRVTNMSERYKEIKSPYSKTQSIESFIDIKPEDTKIGETTELTKHIPGVLDQSMLSSSLKVFDAKYINELLPRDVVKMVTAIQRAGVAVQDYDIQHVNDLNDSYEIHSVKLVPVIGKSTTMRFRIPKVSEDGIMFAGGVKYRMRKQRGDTPFRKVSPSEIALTSYYSKLFVSRSERAMFNYSGWLQNQLMRMSMDTTSGLTDLKLGDAFDPDLPLPRTYTAVAMKYSQFTFQGMEFFWDYHQLSTHIGDSRPKSPGVIVGRKGKQLIHMLPNNQLVIYNYAAADRPGTTPTELGYLEQLLGLDMERRPCDMAELSIYSTAIPVGVVLGYHIGLGNLMETLNVAVRRVVKGKSLDLTPDEYVLRFSDETLVFDRRQHMHTLVFNGFNRYYRDLRKHSVYAFDKQDTYATLLEGNGVKVRFLRELDMMFRMWIDHITLELLEELKLPTDLVHLILKACQLLTSDDHPDAMDIAHMRDRGYERIPGLIYGEMIRALRGYAMRPANALASVDMNPEAIWQQVLQDQSVSPIEEMNPIHALKEREVVVFGGAGGRGGRSITERYRHYHQHSLGVVSEATVDSGDVATITYLTADPNYTSVRGVSRRIGETKGKSAKLISTSFLLAPAADRDD